MIAKLQEALRHHQAGELALAEWMYRQVLAQAPDQPNALFLIGSLLANDGEMEEGLDFLRRAVAARPEHIEGRMVLGDALLRHGALSEAVDVYEDVLRLQPHYALAHAKLVRGLLASGDAAAAIEAGYRAVAALPGCAMTQEALGAGLLSAGETQGALAAADRAIDLEPCRAEGWFLRGTALRQLGFPAEAVEALSRAVAADPAHGSAALNLGNALLDLDRVAEAEHWIRAAIAREPSLAEAYASLAFLLTGQERLTLAVAACKAAIALRPDFVQAHWNQAIAYLAAGDYRRGWAKYEWRSKHAEHGVELRRYHGPAWRGEPLAGQRLLVVAEQGLGDAIQFCRFIPGLAQRGAVVTLACDPSLHALFGQLPGVAAIIDKAGPLPCYDFWVGQMSLPSLLGLTVQRIPAAAGYLKAEADETAAWRKVLGPGAVGLVWAGNPKHSLDAKRSIPAAALLPLVAAGGAVRGPADRGAACGFGGGRRAGPVRGADGFRPHGGGGRGVGSGDYRGHRRGASGRGFGGAVLGDAVAGSGMALDRGAGHHALV